VCKGSARGKRADGTVDVTVQELWPSRQPEPPALTAAEYGQACALLAGCVGTSDAEKLELLGLCIQPLYGMFWEERAVPTTKKHERWAYEARAVLQHAGDCAAAMAVSTKAPEGMNCEEDGCWWKYVEKPAVVCTGDIARMTWRGSYWERDCSHSFAICDAASQTGCSDRLPTACSPGSADRCDGDVRIGCDGTGKVSFHDCARIEGATCGKLADGKLGCVVSEAAECNTGTYTCELSAVVVCVSGKKVQVPASYLGLSACAGGNL